MAHNPRNSTASADHERLRRSAGAPDGSSLVSAEILERITDGFLALDHSGRFAYVNASAEGLLGRPREELIGRSVWDVFPEAAETRVYRKYQKATSEQTTIQFDQLLPSLGRYYRIRLFPSNGGVSVYFRDVSEEKQAEEALRESEAQFRQIAEHIREVLYLTTPDADRLIYASPTFECVWGIPVDRLFADPSTWWRMIDSRDRERVVAALPRMKLGLFEEEYRIHRPDGTVRWILDRAYPVRNEDGEVHRIVGIAEDITAEREAAAERERLLSQETEAREVAERETKLREEVLAIVSHDLKNPLHAIQLSAGTLRDLQLSDEKRRQVIERIISATAGMDRLIQGLLDTSRLEAGQGLFVEPRPVQREDLLREACALFRPQIEEKEIDLRCEAGDGCPPLLADRERLLQVFWNLIGNAVKFTPRGGQVTVRSEEENDVCRFSVADSGAGIPPQSIPRLFDPFWQEKRTARLGTGLGLPISKAIVEAHGGEIWVESSVGHGATFFFTIPLAT